MYFRVSLETDYTAEVYFTQRSPMTDDLCSLFSYDISFTRFNMLVNVLQLEHIYFQS